MFKLFIYFIFMIFIFILPVDISRLFGDSFSSIQTNIKALLTVAIITLFTIFIFENLKIKKYYLLPWHNIIFLFPFFYILLAFASISWTYNIDSTMKSWLLLLSMVMLAELIVSKIKLDSFITLSLYVLDIIIVLSLLLDILGVNFTKMYFVHDVVRYAGITYGAHAIAQVALIALIFRMYFIIKKQNKIDLFNILMLFFYLYSIYLSDSRQVQVAIIVMSLIGLHLFLKSKFSNLIVLYVPLIVVFLMVIFFININIVESMQRTGSEDVYTFTGRTYIWSASIDLIKERYFMGYGFGAGGDALYDYYGTLSLWTTYSAHNLYIQQLLDLGVIGLSFVLTMIIYYIYISIKLKESLFLFYILMILVIGMMERSLSGAPGLLYFFFIIFFFYMKKIVFYKNHFIKGVKY